MSIYVKRIFIPVIISLAITSILVVVRGIVFKLLRKWAERTATKLDDLIIESFKTPSIYWCLAIGLYIGVDVPMEL